MDAEGLLREVTALRDELAPGRRVGRVRLDSHFERELGFDSLARAELLLRVERASGQRLPAELLGSAETAADLLDALRDAGVAHAIEAPVGADTTVIAVSAIRLAAPTTLTTLVEVLHWHGAQQPEVDHIVYLDDSGSARRISFGLLLQQAQTAAAALQARGIVSGDAVALMLPTCPEFFPSFLGILLAGGVPVPIYPPARPSQLEDHLRRHSAILSNARVRLLISAGEVALAARLLAGRIEGLLGVALTDELLSHVGSPPQPVPVVAGQLGLLQYTSGSTGTPKGVMLTHAHLLANIRSMAQAADINGDDVFVSWLPLYHDMGLICAWLSSLVHGLPFVVMSPLSFLASPERWLRAIHDYRGTLSGAPNFAYELCQRRIDPSRLATLDLSAWRIAFNGAEPVNAGTMRRFATRFASCGLRADAIAPVYGLAECAVGLAFTPGRGLHVDRIKRDVFVSSGSAQPLVALPEPLAAGKEEADPMALSFVACGRPLPGYQIRIVDAHGAELPERREGRLQFRGPSATTGYFENPTATAQLIGADGWLDSGDYAYLAAGEVYPTGRAKDIIIKGGRNIYPQEVEEAVGRLEGIRSGCVAVFGSPDPVSGTERLVVAAETRLEQTEALDALRSAVRAAVIAVLGMPPDEIMLSSSRIVLKTSSGKVRRAASRDLFERGSSSETAPRAVWLQVLRLMAGGILPLVRRCWHALGRRLWGVWAALAFIGVALVTWPLIAVSPAPTFCWGLARAATRAWLRLAGIRLSVSIEEDPPHAAVLVCNHASYVDVVVLAAALPWRPWRFVAKRELAANPVVRIFLSRLGVELVERFDTRESVADANRLAVDATAGASLMMFPEGTFSRVPGLQAFRMGAFSIAAQNGLPVVPLALAGTRDVLRDGQWLPQRGQVRLSIGAPMRDDGRDWSAAVRLRDAARDVILRDCGEPDLQL